MEEAISILHKTPQAAREAATLQFLAAAGFLVITSDGDPDDAEVQGLVNLLSPLHFWPPGVLDEYLKKSSRRILRKRIAESAKVLVAQYPQDIRPVFAALIPLISQDRKIEQSEIDALFEVAEEYLGIPRPEAVEMILAGMVEHFKPIG